MKASPTAIAIAASVAVLAGTTAYVAEGLFSRFDRAFAMIEQVPATLASVDASTQKLRAVMDEFEAKMSKARAAMPAVGKEVGESGAEMVDAMKRRLDLMDAMRGMEKPAGGRRERSSGKDSGGSGAELADALERHLDCWKSKRELGRSGEPIGMWCGYEDRVEKEPGTEEELRQALSNPDQPRRPRSNLDRGALDRFGILELNAGSSDDRKAGSLLSDVRTLLQRHKAEADTEGQVALTDGGQK